MGEEKASAWGRERDMLAMLMEPVRLENGEGVMYLVFE